MATVEFTDRYLDLIRAFPLRPLRSDEELARAIEVLDALSDRADRTPDETAYMMVLARLVEDLESTVFPAPDVSDAAMLRHLMEDAQGITQSQLSAATGIDQTTISLVLSGKRELTRKHIEILSHYFHIRPDVFFRPDS